MELEIQLIGAMAVGCAGSGKIEFFERTCTRTRTCT